MVKHLMQMCNLPTGLTSKMLMIYCATPYHHCVTAQQTPDINLINNDDAI